MVGRRQGCREDGGEVFDLNQEEECRRMRMLYGALCSLLVVWEAYRRRDERWWGVLGGTVKRERVVWDGREGDKESLPWRPSLEELPS